MVILRGYVRDAEESSEYGEVMVSEATITQGTRVVLTSSNGTFYTSADTTLDYVTCEADRYRTVDYSIPVFATRYDPLGVISGTITRPIDITTHPGHTFIWDDGKLFLPNTLVGRVLEMRSGIDDGLTAEIAANTQNGIELGGGGSGDREWVEVDEDPHFTARAFHSSVTMPDGKILVLGGERAYQSYLNDVWMSEDNGVTWTLQTPLPNSRWEKRRGHSSVELSGWVYVMGGLLEAPSHDVWETNNNGASWAPLPHAQWTARYGHASVVWNGTTNSFTYSSSYLPSLPNSNYWRGEYSTDGTYLVVSYGSGYPKVGDTRLLKLSGDIYTDLGVLISGTPIINGNPFWSPDGNYLAVNNGSLFIFKRSGDTLTKLTNPIVVPSSSEGGIGWSPDGTHLIMGGSGNGASGAMLYARIGDTFTNISGNGGIMVNSPYELHYYSNHVVFADWATEFLKVYKRSGDAYTLISTLEQADGGAWSDACYSPDGKYLLACSYEDYSSSNITIYSISGDTYTSAGSVFVEGGSLSSINMSQDGEIFAVGADSTFDDGAQMYSFSNGVATKITPEPLYINDSYTGNWFSQIIFSPDNVHITALGGYWSSYFLGLNAFKRTKSDTSNILVIGGQTATTAQNDVWSSPNGGITWVCMSSGTITPWEPRADHTCVVISGNIVLMGGMADGNGYNDVWKSENGGATWECLTSNAMWSKRSQHNSVVLQDGSIVLYGGDYLI